MCGIVGVLSFTSSNFRVSDFYLTRMRDVMSHRGPDGAGIFVSGDRRLGLGFVGWRSSTFRKEPCSR